jgi:hypothetical protein
MSAHSGQRKRGEACRRVIRVAGRGVRHSVMPVDELDLARMSGDIPDPTKHEEAGTAGGTVRPSGARCSAGARSARR